MMDFSLFGMLTAKHSGTRSGKNVIYHQRFIQILSYFCPDKFHSLAWGPKEAEGKTRFWKINFPSNFRYGRDNFKKSSVMGKKCREQSHFTQKDTRQMFRKWRLYVWLYICSLACDLSPDNFLAQCRWTSHGAAGYSFEALGAHYFVLPGPAGCSRHMTGKMPKTMSIIRNCLKQRMMNVYISGAPSVGSSPQEEFLYKQILPNILQYPSDLCTSAQSLANKTWTFSLKSSA